MLNSKILLSAGLISVLLLTGCSSTTSTPEDATAPADISSPAEEETLEASEFNENEINYRATLCEELLADNSVDKTSSEYRGCQLESEIPKIASFLASEGLIFHVLTNEKNLVVELVSFTDTNANGKFDEEERVGSYLVPQEVLNIEVVKDENSEIEGTQVSGLSSMLFTIPSL